MPWLDEATLTPSGLLLRGRAGSRLPESAERVLPYEMIGFVIDKDGVHGTIFDREKPGTALLTLTRRYPNFYPVFLLIRWLTEEAATERPLSASGESGKLPGQ